MANWTTIPDTDLDANSPITEQLMYALRDNVVAVTEGASGAPKVSNNAFTDNTINGAKIINQSLAFSKIGSGTLGATTNIQLQQNQTYIIPEGWYYSYTAGATGVFQVNINSSWGVIDAGYGATNVIYFYSDGTNVRLVGGVSTGTYNFYLRKLS